MAYLGPNSEEDIGKDGFQKLFSENDEFERFKNFIEKESYLLTKRFSGSMSFMHHFMVNANVTEEKLRFLIHQGVDMIMENARKENFLQYLLKNCQITRLAENLLMLFKLEPDYFIQF